LYIKDFQNKNVTCAWLNRIRGILNDCGMSYIWNRQTCISDKWLKLVFLHAKEAYKILDELSQ
jgi:hypothetical protein